MKRLTLIGMMVVLAVLAALPAVAFVANSAPDSGTSNFEAAAKKQYPKKKKKKKACGRGQVVATTKPACARAGGVVARP